MALTYIHTPIEVLKLPDLNIRQKLLLGLVKSFGSTGLMMSNESLAEILDVVPKRLTYLIKNLKSRGHITIKNPRSKYRRIYFNANDDVNSCLLQSEGRSAFNLLQCSDSLTSMQTLNRNKKNLNKKKNNTSVIRFSFEKKKFDGITPQLLERWAKVYPSVDIEGELLRAAEWVLANPQRNKKNWARFLTNWLCRSQQRKGDTNYGYAFNRQPSYAGRPGEFIR